MSLGPRLTGVLSLALFVALPLSFAALTAANFAQLAGTEEVIARQEGLLAELDRRIARLAAEGGPPIDTSAIYVAADGPAIAAADLQQRLGKLTADAGGTLVETQVEPAREGAADGEVAVRLAVDVGNEGLARLLSAIEGGLPLMFVDAVAVRILDRGGAGAPDDPNLRAELTVRAAWKSP